AWLLSGHLSQSDVGTVASGFVFVCIVLSLVVVTGLSGQVSLMQMSFVGIGAVVMSELPSGVPWIAGVVIAAAVTGIAGGLVARLRVVRRWVCRRRGCCGPRSVVPLSWPGARARCSAPWRRVSASTTLST